MDSENHVLSDDDLKEIASLSSGYSGADMKSLCQEASLGPIRSMSFDMINNIEADQVNLTQWNFKTVIFMYIKYCIGTSN